MPVKDNSLTINDQEFFQLDQIIGEIPTKYGIKIVQFFSLVRQKRLQEQTEKMPQSPGPLPETSDNPKTVA
jgi:hypothetical protein